MILIIFINENIIYVKYIYPMIQLLWVYLQKIIIIFKTLTAFIYSFDIFITNIYESFIN